MGEDQRFFSGGFSWQKLIAFIVLLVICILFWYLLDIVLITFILTFVFYHLTRVSQKGLKKLFPFSIPDGVVIGVLYVVILGAIILVMINYLPRIGGEFSAIAQLLLAFDIEDLEGFLWPGLYDLVSKVDLSFIKVEATELTTKILARIGVIGLDIFLSIILSIFLLIEKEKIFSFGRRMETSRVNFIYAYLLRFGKSFVKTFGKVMKVQVLIAFINSIVSMVALTCMGFPQILGLGIMIFCLGLIPVAGVIISLIPLCIIGFSIGGIMKVVAVLIMIAVIHAIEAYILNPKLMSSKVELPVCFVFIILIFGEHYLGVWGLLIGVPCFVFLMDILGVDYEGSNKGPRQLRQEERRARRKAAKAAKERK